MDARIGLAEQHCNRTLTCWGVKSTLDILAETVPVASFMIPTAPAALHQRWTDGQSHSARCPRLGIWCGHRLCSRLRPPSSSGLRGVKACAIHGRRSRYSKDKNKNAKNGHESDSGKSRPAEGLMVTRAHTGENAPEFRGHLYAITVLWAGPRDPRGSFICHSTELAKPRKGRLQSRTLASQVKICLRYWMFRIRAWPANAMLCARRSLPLNPRPYRPRPRMRRRPLHLQPFG